MDFFSRLEDVRSRWNVLEHSFYTRWSAGELTAEELASYSGQYRHAVVALADAAESAAATAAPELRAALTAHAAEERSHVALWDRFAVAAGGDPAAAATAETERCAEAWAGDDRDNLATLVALYAIESGQPAISTTKLDGLREHYDHIAADGSAYFELHAELDVQHAAQERALIEPMLADADVQALLDEAERVLEANWQLLDGVERINGR